LNRAIDFAHENRLTRHQQVIFAMADMMAHVEVADRMAQLAVNRSDETTLATARVFANGCARIVADNARTIGLGTGGVDDGDVDRFMSSLDLPSIEGSYRGLIDDMDRIADHIFGRTS
jgi:alkylation response protein AidB-like acyl-CoA dehydrogenase